MDWEPERWLREFGRASASGRGFRELRAQVFESTVAIVRGREYACGGRTVRLDDDDEYLRLHAATVMYPHTRDLRVRGPRSRAVPTKIDVVEGDCLESARSLQTQGLNPAVLNMASRRNPGGAVLSGAGAQEENLFRRSNLLCSMYQFVDFGWDYGVPRSEGFSYPIGRESGGIYSPDVSIFRSSEASGYALLAEPYRASVVSVPAIPNPPVHEVLGELRLTEEAADGTREKIRAILRISACHGHDSVVLSAFGCGAFRNPPGHMAELFAEVLAEDEFAAAFDTLCFSIIDDHNAWRPHNPEGNYQPFLRQFEGTDA
jgi:uncharacterized protein (TIGR02452 family)